MGEMPPSTSGSSGLACRMARAEAITISANIFQSGSSLKSQWDRLLGSFHSITASTMHAPFARAGPGLQSACQFVVQNIPAVFLGDLGGSADPSFLLRMRPDLQPGAAQHRLHGAVVGNPPVRGVARIFLLDKVHAGKIRPGEDFGVPEMIIIAQVRAGERAANH